MAFLRFTRDKRGYEQFSLVEQATNRRGKSRTRVLYWYRTPPNVRVGREPFDESVRRALEAQYPGVEFDWRKIVEMPIPSAEAERWRERRRTEKAEKAVRRATPDAEERAEIDEVEDDETSKIESAGAELSADVDLTSTTDSPPAANRERPAARGASRRRHRRRQGRHTAAPQSQSDQRSDRESDLRSDRESESGPESRSDREFDPESEGD